MATIAYAEVAEVGVSGDVLVVDGNVLGVEYTESSAEAFDAVVAFTPSDPNGTGTETVAVVASSSIGASIRVSGRGRLDVFNNTVPFYAPPSGTVNNIEDLPTGQPDGTVYTVLGTAANREMLLAIYYAAETRWVYQPVSAGQNTASISYVNPTTGTNFEMQDFIPFKGMAHVPQYWSKSVLTGTNTYALVDIEVDEEESVFGGTPPVIWRWKVADLPDPGDGSYKLTSWPETNGIGPTWTSNYSPKVKSRTTFNVKKNKSRAQRSVHFDHTKVHHMTMEGDVDTPFTVIIVGIIQSYPTAKYGHYLLDSGKRTSVRTLTGGKDYFFSEGTNPRQVMLFMKRTARIGTNTHPAKDMKKYKNIRFKHSEKPRPRMFYGVFNGANSRAGAIDTKYKFSGSGDLEDLGTHHYWSIGRRVNRVSDNRATHLSLWDVSIIHAALTQEEIDKYYENIASEYRFKEYS